MKAVGYVRVSTLDQAREGVSLDVQSERVRAYCSMAGLDLVATIREEGVSGARPLDSRPGGQDLLKALAGGQVSHVVALKLDRLFRDAVDALTSVREWDRAGVSLHLVDLGGQTLNTGSAMGRMFLTMTAAFAELERNLISERTRTALQHKKAQGIRLGGVPLGETDEELCTVARIFELRGQDVTFRAIAATLTAEGHRTKKGGQWAPQTVRKVLARGFPGKRQSGQGTQ